MAATLKAGDFFLCYIIFYLLCILECRVRVLGDALLTLSFRVVWLVGIYIGECVLNL